MPNPNEVKFVTKLNRFERATTFIEERFSFEVHRKSYSRWKKCTFDLGLRKFSNMFDFPNFHLKIHHDPSFKWTSVQHESCSPWSHLSKTSKIISFGPKLNDLRMVSLWEVFWQDWTPHDHFHLHACTWWFQQTLYTIWDWIASLLRPKWLPMHPCKWITIFVQFSSGANIKHIAYLNKLKASDSSSTPCPSFARSIQTITSI